MIELWLGSEFFYSHFLVIWYVIWFDLVFSVLGYFLNNIRILYKWKKKKKKQISKKNDQFNNKIIRNNCYLDAWMDTIISGLVIKL